MKINLLTFVLFANIIIECSISMIIILFTNKSNNNEKNA